MSLQDIKNNLYKKEGSEEEKRTFSAWEGENQIKKKEIQTPSDQWEAPRSGMSERVRKILKTASIIVGCLLLLTLAFWGAIAYRKSAFSQDNLILSWQGSQETTSGEVNSYTFSWENNNRADLNGAVLKIKFPNNFHWEDMGGLEIGDNNIAELDLGTISGKSKGSITFAGKIYSPQGAFVYLGASLDYQPSNVSSSFSKESQIGILSDSSPLGLEVSATSGVASGGLVRFEISYRNTQDSDFSNLRLQARYPQGFSFASASLPTLEGDDFWLIGDLKPQEEGKIIVEGEMSGNQDEIKKTNFSLGVFEDGKFSSLNDVEVSTKIVSSPFSITQTAKGQDDSGSVQAGETVNFVINFKNQGDVGLRDVIVTEYLESPALDFSSLRLEDGGSYDSNEHTITWKTAEYSDFANLAAGKEGSIRFSIKLKDELPIENANDKNFVIKSVAKIDSPDVPNPIGMNKVVASNLLSIKVSSPISLESLGYYNDSVLENYGPIPPQVGKETTYAIHWKVSSFSNDIQDARVEAFLPSGVSFTGSFDPRSENISFNPRTNKVVWDLGEVASGTGKISDKKEIVFQIKINPSIDQIGKEVILVKNQAFIGKDKFTGENIYLKIDEKTTDLPEDVNTPSGRGEVVK